MKIIDSIKKDFNTMTWVLIPVAIAINVVIGQIVVLLRLPVYLDSIGTMLVAALAGPWAGALTGTLSNIIWGLAIDPNAFPWFPVALFIGFVTGWCAVAGLFKNWWKVAVTGFFVAITAAVVSTPIAVYLYGGITASGSSFITAYLLETGRGVVEAVISTNFLVEPIDKIATTMLAFAIVIGLSKRYISRFPRSENVSVDEDFYPHQLMIPITLVFVVISAGTIFLPEFGNQNLMYTSFYLTVVSATLIWVLYDGKQRAVISGAWFAWVVIFVMLGPVAFLVYLNKRPRGITQICSSCGKNSPVLDDICPHCGKLI
jgi:energy-coupling factor transport system substrate-specific component